MRIALVVGQVLDPSGFTVNRRSGRLFINREDYTVQPADRCAVEAALRLKDTSEGEVIALPRSPMPTDDILRQALALGSDRAIRFVGDMLEDADDAVMARLLTGALDRLGDIDLVLMGSETLDTGHSQLGSRSAGVLGWPQILSTWRIELGDGRVSAVLKQGGQFVLVDVGLPAVVTVAPATLRLRYPSGSRLINTYRNPDAVEIWEARELADGPDLHPLVQPMGKEFPPVRERGNRLEGTAQQLGQALADVLRLRL